MRVRVGARAKAKAKAKAKARSIGSGLGLGLRFEWPSAPSTAPSCRDSSAVVIYQQNSDD